MEKLFIGSEILIVTTGLVRLNEEILKRNSAARCVHTEPMELLGGSAENGVNSTQMTQANGQFNKFLSEVEIDSADYTFPRDSAFFFMMGTNTGTIGNMPEGGVGKITDETCTTDISAMNYILKRIRYYGRKQPIGVFIRGVFKQTIENN